MVGTGRQDYRRPQPHIGRVGRCTKNIAGTSQTHELDRLFAGVTIASGGPNSSGHCSKRKPHRLLSQWGAAPSPRRGAGVHPSAAEWIWRTERKARLLTPLAVIRYRHATGASDRLKDVFDSRAPRPRWSRSGHANGATSFGDGRSRSVVEIGAISVEYLAFWRRACPVLCL